MAPLKPSESRKKYNEGHKAELFMTTMENQFKNNLGKEIPEVDYTSCEIENSTAICLRTVL